MGLRNASLLVMIGILVNFVTRSIGTLLPSAFIHPLPVLTGITFQLLADLTIILFFVSFQKSDYCVDNAPLRAAAQIAAVGAVVGMLIPLKALLFQLRVIIFLPLFATRGLELLAPPAATLSLLYFLYLFHQETATGTGSRLLSGIRAGMAGTVIFLLLHLLAVTNYVIHYFSNRLASVSHWTTAVTFPLVVTATAAFFFFFMRVRQETPTEATGIDL